MNQELLMKRFCGLAGVLLGVAALGCAAWGNPPEAPGHAFYLGQLPPREIAHYSRPQIEHLLSALHHVPFESSGVVPVMLPFHYVDPQHLGHAEEANAFAFLLSDALDWADGNASSRHAYFLFKRMAFRMQPLTKDYDPDLISHAITGIDGTHAVGGELGPSANGYTGRLQIFDMHGAVASEKVYATPRAYFDLLGDMSVDALAFFGKKANPALTAYLHAPRTKNFDLIRKLGEVAFTPDRQSEFATYRDILAADPNFAEVRYWWANQRWWTEQNRSAFEEDKALSLQSRITMAPICDFVQSDCPDKALAARYPAWVDEAERLAGPDSVPIVRTRLSQMPTVPTLELITRALHAAERFPNDDHLVRDVAYAYERSEGPADLDIAASCYLTVIINNSENAGDNETAEFDRLRFSLMGLGDHELLAELIAARKAARTPAEIQTLIECLVDMGKYSSACDIYFAGHDAFTENRGRSASYAALAAAVSNNRGKLDRVLSMDGQSLRENGVYDAFVAARDYLAGRPLDDAVIVKAYMESHDGAMRRLLLPLLAEHDWMNNEFTYASTAYIYACQHPLDRFSWILMDGYESRAPLRNDGDFYIAMRFLKPECADVQAMVQAWTKRGMPAPDPSPAENAAVIKASLAERWPMKRPSDQPPEFRIRQIKPYRVASRIAALVHDNQMDAAHDLALRYHDLAVQDGSFDIIVFSNHLIHRVEQIQEDVKQVAPVQPLDAGMRASLTPGGIPAS
jgi:hypothetical protein